MRAYEQNTQQSPSLGFKRVNVSGAGSPFAADQSDINDVTPARSELKLTATQTGAYPVEMCSGTDSGPYDFTAYVKHAVKLAIPRLSTLPREGTLRVAAHTPDGGVISDPTLRVAVEIKVGSGWKTVGMASVANATATIVGAV